jgi:hypothetical protein
MTDVRDHGLGPPSTPTGKPTATPIPDDVRVSLEQEGGCPNCGGTNTIFQISVAAEHPLLKSSGTCKYLGCAACPWASPAITVINKEGE